MKRINLTFLLLISVIFIFSGFALGVKGLEILIEGKLSEQKGPLKNKIIFNVVKNKNDAFDYTLKSYAEIKDAFNKAYKDDRTLISESSTVKQAFEHSKQMLETCLKYEDDYSDLKEHAILQLLVGDWSGNAEIIIKEKGEKEELSLKRKLEINFESNQAGQLSKGIVKGTEILLQKEIPKEEDPEEEIIDVVTIEDIKKDTREITGSITGNIIPQADSKFVITIDKDSTNKNTPDKFNSVEITAKTKLKMAPIVSRETIDEAFSLTVSHMKIYYNLLFKTKRPVESMLQDKFDLFFNDILYLLNVLSTGYISKEVYEPLGIYPESEYVNNAFEDYVITLSSYYNKQFLSSTSKKFKISSYKSYMSELMQINAVCHLGIVDPKLVDRLDLNINKSDNLISKVFARYYDMGKAYYSKQIKKASGEEKVELKKEYTRFLKEANAIVKTGIIHKEVLKEIKFNQKNSPRLASVVERNG